MMRLFTGLLFLWVFTTQITFSQNVAINTTGAVANNSAMLDVDAPNKGLLIPRVTLTATNSNAPIGATVITSLMVYNTAASGAGATAVSPGYYYWDGGQWVRLFNTGNAWQTTGNYGTNPAANYLGTADANDLVFRTNAVERMRINTAGNIGIGTPTPGVKVDIIGAGNANVDLRVNGRIQTGDGGGNGGIWLSNANDGFVGNNGANIGFWTNSVGWNAFQIVKATGNVGVGMTAPTARIDAVTTNNFFDCINGRNNDPTGTGITGTGNNGIWNGLVAGSGGSFSGVATGSFHYFSTGAAGQGIIIQDAFGAQWNVGHWTGAAYRKILGPGTVSTIVKDLNDEYVVMNCPESPENLFQDYGIGTLVNGKAHIDIDPILTKNILVDETHPLKVFIQLEGDCAGVYVTNKTAQGFDVIELNNGTSNVSFSYSIVATHGNQTYEADGIIREAKYDTRFEKAPIYQENKIGINRK